MCETQSYGEKKREREGGICLTTENTHMSLLSKSDR